jgi:outer membrane lipoprotein-sorting protein
MVSPITKLAAAAVVILAGLLGLNILSGPHSHGVAWARIPDHVKAIDTFMFRLTIGVHGKNGASVSDEHTGQFTFYLSEQHGFRMDIRGDGTVVSWYVPPESDTITMVVPGEKKWSKSPLPPEQRGQMPEEYQDPAEYIKRFMARPYQELGRSVIDGVEVEGIEVTDPPTDGGTLENGIGRMWVDVQTELPVRIEIEGKADGMAVQWLMEFKWSAAVDPAVFEPNIPSDYTPLAQ